MKCEDMVAVLEKQIRRQNVLTVKAEQRDCWPIAREHRAIRDGLVLAMTTLIEAWGERDGV